MSIVDEAERIATQAHAGVKRKWSDQDYIEHPKQVYERVRNWRGNVIPEHRTIMECAAWVHDVIEDAPEDQKEYYTQEIRQYCGEPVLKLAQELTNASKRPEYKGLKRAERKAIDRQFLAQASWEAKIIKLFDRICNLNDMFGCDDAKYLLKYAEESRALLEVIGDADQDLAQELLNCILALETHALMMDEEPQNEPSLWDPRSFG